jgi:hypothetical protein
MTVRIPRWATGCVAAASVVLLAGAIALAYADRHLVPASGWDFGSVVEEATFMVVPADLARVVQTALEPAHVSVWTSRRG